MDASTKTRVSLASTIHPNFSPSSSAPCADTLSVVAEYRKGIYAARVKLLFYASVLCAYPTIL